MTAQKRKCTKIRGSERGVHRREKNLGGCKVAVELYKQARTTMDGERR